MWTPSPEMMQRAARRKSGWNLLLIPLALIGIGLTWLCVVRGLLALRTRFFPESAFLMNGNRVGNIAMYASPFFPSIALGLLFANYCVWLIPAARRALSGEAEGYPGTDFRSANKGLARYLVIFSMVALPIGILGSTSYFYLTENAITYRPTILQAERSYPWSELSAVETACWRSKGWNYSYKLVMKDGTKVEILESPRDFVRSYPVLARILAGQSYTFDSHDVYRRCQPDDLKLILSTALTISSGVE